MLIEGYTSLFFARQHMDFAGCTLSEGFYPVAIGTPLRTITDILIEENKI
jgi:hypothetical protein